MIALPRIRTMAVLLTATAALAACAPKAPKVLPPDPGANTNTQTSGGGIQAPVPGSQADFVAQMMGQDTIYFDTDRYNIDSADQAALTAQAQLRAWLEQMNTNARQFDGSQVPVG